MRQPLTGARWGMILRGQESVKKKKGRQFT